MKYSEYKYFVFSDLYRITSNVKTTSLIWQVMTGESFKYIFWMRTCLYARTSPLLKFTIFPFARIMLNHQIYKLGISIPYRTQIGSGFCIGHFGGIIINVETMIGKNCSISHGVTLGQADRGKNKGCPQLGENVYVGPGARIFGAVKIGNNVAIGANCVVTKDIPDNSVVVGIPGRVISQEGSIGYVKNIDYGGKIC